MRGIAPIRSWVCGVWGFPIGRSRPPARRRCLPGCGAPGAHPLNAIPRRCGRFFWAQAYGAVAAGASMLYGAMFDEVDEGTALFKTIPQAARAPTGFLTLDADGCALPDDWYLRLSGAVAAMPRGAAALSPALPFPPP